MKHHVLCMIVGKHVSFSSKHVEHNIVVAAREPIAWLSGRPEELIHDPMG